MIGRALVINEHANESKAGTTLIGLVIATHEPPGR